MPGPLVPAGLAAYALSTTKVQLLWTNNASNETSFRVEYQSGSDWLSLGTTSPGTTQYTDSGLSAGQSRTYRVFAIGAAGDSAASATASATTPALDAPAASTAPRNLVASSAGSSSVALAWNAPLSGNPSGYLLEQERPADNDNWGVIWDGGGQTTSITSSVYVQGGVYQYRLLAYTLHGANAAATISAPSNTAPYTLPYAAPNAPNKYDGHYGVNYWHDGYKATFWWDMAGPDIDGYNVYSVASDGFTKTLLDTLLPSQNYYTPADVSLSNPLTTYYITTFKLDMLDPGHRQLQATDGITLDVDLSHAHNPDNDTAAPTLNSASLSSDGTLNVDFTLPSLSLSQMQLEFSPDGASASPTAVSDWIGQGYEAFTAAQGVGFWVRVFGQNTAVSNAVHVDGNFLPAPIDVSAAAVTGAAAATNGGLVLVNWALPQGITNTSTLGIDLQGEAPGASQWTDLGALHYNSSLPPLGDNPEEASYTQYRVRFVQSNQNNEFGGTSNTTFPVQGYSDWVYVTAPSRPAQTSPWLDTPASGAVDLFWDDNSQGEDSYLISWSNNSSMSPLVGSATTAAGAMQYSVAGLDPTKYYYFTVQAKLDTVLADNPRADLIPSIIPSGPSSGNFSIAAVGNPARPGPDGRMQDGWFVVTRGGDLSAGAALTINFSGTAVAGTDYTLAPGGSSTSQLIQFAAYQSSAVIEVAPLNNPGGAASPTVTAKIANSSGSGATLTIGQPGIGPVKLLIDSNNDSGLTVPSPDNTPATEQATANAPNTPGKIIQVDDNDLNGNNIPDFADGFGKFGNNAVTTTAQGGGFVPLTIVLPTGVDPTQASLSFTYSASDPNNLSRSGAGTAASPYIYAPAKASPDIGGALRLWTKDELSQRLFTTVVNGGDWIKSGESFNASSLTWANGRAQVYVEAVAASATQGDQQIQLTLTVSGGTYLGQSVNTAVRATAVSFNSAFDGNRSNAVTLDGQDSTTGNNPYAFWINDNSDLMTTTSDFNRIGNIIDPGSYVRVQDSVSGRDPDSANNLINGTRDLQDFAPYVIAITVPAGSSVYDQITFQMIGINGKPAPSLRLWSGINNGTAYLSGFGADLVNTDNANNWQTIQISGQPVTIPRSSSNTRQTLDGRFKHADQNGATNYFLMFEGITAGIGRLIVKFSNNGYAVGQTSAYLTLASANDMFEHYSADPADSPNAQHAYGAFQYTSSSPQTNDYVLYVHGWNMSAADKLSFSETAYKRLFWQGYKGKFGFFSWPTLTLPDESRPVAVGHAALSAAYRQNYDTSEQIAYNSAPTLLAVLAALNTQYPGRVNMFAHSMGNVVASEALRLEAVSAAPAKIVHTYVASQAATAAGAYNGLYPRSLPANGTPDLYGNYTGTAVPYFNGLQKAAQTLVNFYNFYDWALSADGWVFDQKTKPDGGFGFGAPPVDGNGLQVGVDTPPLGIASIYQFWTYAANGHVVYLNPYSLNDIHIILSFIDPAETLPLGRAGDVDGPFSQTLDMNAVLGFGAHHWQHSAEFMSDYSEVGAYWGELLRYFGIQ